MKENRFCFYFSVVFYVEAKCETVWTSTLHQGSMWEDMSLLLLSLVYYL